MTAIIFLLLTPLSLLLSHSSDVEKRFESEKCLSQSWVGGKLEEELSVIMRKGDSQAWSIRLAV